MRSSPSQDDVRIHREPGAVDFDARTDTHEMSEGDMRDTITRVEDGLLSEALARMGAGFVILDSAGRIKYANSAACRSLALVPDCAGVNLIEAVPKLRALLSDTANPRCEHVSIEVPAGCRRDLFVTTEKPGPGDNRILMISDGSLRLQAEDRRLRAQQLSVAEKMAARLSHELKNPLASILAGLQTLESEPYLSSEDRFVLQLVLDEVRSVGNVINGLLDSAKGGVGVRRPIPVQGLLQSSLEFIRPFSLKKDVSLKLIKGPEGIRILADEKALKRAIANLLRNAVEASKMGANVSLGWRELDRGEKKAVLPGFHGRVLGVYGEDCGKGLPEDLSISTIFKPFVSTKVSSIGLGLSAAQDIVERHGGVISLSPVPSGGARFEILLPFGNLSECGDESLSVTPRCDDCPIEPVEGNRVARTEEDHDNRAAGATTLDNCVTCINLRDLNLAPYYSPKSGKEE